MRVFQIEREIKAIVQGDRLIQKYATNLERLWADLILSAREGSVTRREKPCTF
jgi:hypothetical protein